MGTLGENDSMKFYGNFLLGFFLLFLTVALSSCSVATLRVESQPEGADVLININGQSSKKIGQTPLNLLESTLGTNDQPFQLVVSKEGFQTENILVPPTSFSRATLLQMHLKEISSSNKVMNDLVLQKVASQTALVQSLIKSKEYEQAESSLNTLIAQYPGVATFHELTGNIHYLRRDLSRALGSYRKAYDLNPSNVDTLRMINKIEGIRGERSTSSEGSR
jgi:tetratricopeptide (TPR) repeat protein